ncbi:MAG: hypothetical protein ACJAT5_000484 [Lentimonas sp.]|jgi:hypothetical protein
MNSRSKTTRKNFLKWSGLAAAGGAFLAGNYVFGRKMDPLETKVASSESPTAMSRIRPAREAVVRKSV